MPVVAGRATIGKAPPGLTADVMPSKGAAPRFAKALGALQAEPAVATRGAKEMKLYQAAAPSVVLIVTDDALGSGAIISADGKIITNLHVVGDNDEVGVIFKPKGEGDDVTESEVHAAKVIRRDGVTDLALVQLADVPAGVKPLALGGDKAVSVGSDVHAIGHPTGEAWTYTRGIVSQIRKDYSWVAEDKIRHTATVVQTQTPINPGNSGGPLLDDNMEIVGINSFSSDGEGLNFAVSAADVKIFLARTDDRLAVGQKKKKASKKKKATACEAAILSEEPMEKPKGVRSVVDADCDGKADAVVLTPDDKREAITYMFDGDEDGKIDTLYMDKNRDGDFDYALYDTDGDGKPDLSGEFRKGEDEPYRYERIK